VAERKIIIQTKNHPVRDASLAVDAFFRKKFGYNWKSKHKRGEIPEDDINKAQAEFQEMMRSL
jgi:ribosome recycling factor